MSACRTWVRLCPLSTEPGHFFLFVPITCRKYLFLVNTRKDVAPLRTVWTAEPWRGPWQIPCVCLGPSVAGMGGRCARLSQRLHPDLAPFWSNSLHQGENCHPLRAIKGRGHTHAWQKEKQRPPQASARLLSTETALSTNYLVP